MSAGRSSSLHRRGGSRGARCRGLGLQPAASDEAVHSGVDSRAASPNGHALIGAGAHVSSATAHVFTREQIEILNPSRRGTEARPLRAIRRSIGALDG